MLETYSPIIVALDDPKTALALAKKLDPKYCQLKVGSVLFTAAGPDIIKQLHDLGFAIFLDLKLYDIPNTVYKTCEQIAKLGIWMFTIHTSGGSAMIQAAKDAINQRSKVIGVTLLTSFNQAMVADIGLPHSIEEHVLQLAKLGMAAGLDGLVCSPHEVTALRQTLGDDLCLVTPGIRDQVGTDDQQRTMTASEALAAGSRYLVIGRPITQAADPAAALAMIHANI